MPVLTALLSILSIPAFIFPQINPIVPNFTIPQFTFTMPQAPNLPSARTSPSTISPVPSASPSLKPSASPTIKPSPTPSTSPKRTISPKPSVSPSSAPTSGQTKKDYIMNAINNFRTSKGLSKVNTDSYTCNFATTRAKEISTSFNHDGFRQRIDSKTLPYPSYSQITENIAMTSDYKQVVTLWINSSGHNANMQKDTPFVCVESYGNYYAYEGWKP